MKELAALANLTWLNLSCSADVTDVGLKELTTLKNLTWLYLGDPLRRFKSKVTDAGVKELQKALPRCEISK